MAPDLQFISLLRAGSSSSRDTRPTSRRPTYYLRHFREAGRLVRERQHPFRDARPIIYVTSRRRVAQFARDSANFVTPDRLFTSLRGGGLPSSREAGPKSSHMTYYLRHFCERGRCSCPAPPSCPRPSRSPWNLPNLMAIKWLSLRNLVCPARPTASFLLPLRAGSPSLRETTPIPPHLTHYLHDFREPGRPVRQRRTNPATPGLLFTSLLRAGSPSSRETAPTPPHLTNYLRHFCEPGSPSSRQTGPIP